MYSNIYIYIYLFICTIRQVQGILFEARQELSVYALRFYIYIQVCYFHSEEGITILSLLQSNWMI